MTFENAARIDLADYILTGEGANGVSYDCLSDRNIMVKMYNPGYDITCIVEEHDLARKVWSIGIPSPEPGELVTDGSRLGIRFRKIIGKRSFARAISQEPDRLPELVTEFARTCKGLHATECPAGMFPRAKDTFLGLLEADKVLDAGEKGVLAGFIRDVPECRTALHGDMHFGNVLTTMPQGAAMDTPHELYFIDLGYFAEGCPLFDVGMTWMICNLSDAAFVEHDFHFGLPVARSAWTEFCREYFFGVEKLGEKWFGPGATPETVSEGMKPFVACKLLLVEFNVGFMPDHYIPFLKETVASLAKRNNH